MKLFIADLLNRPRCGAGRSCARPIFADGTEFTNCFCAKRDRPGIDLDAADLLMLIGLLTGVHNRKLMREAQVSIGIG
ncbi:hypothetical protein [Bradyrhizobium sp. 18]|uniref:hypothetical protein n=1 Tax=Bradyrhizobium sp. 18 TaxID=2782657 RepID=UPI001FFC2205|nr:hypothetical protein [Bradyrhizobium sp. 18]MCK1506521.1 hypothetical protein [Bradyrhizobium sp. 18]